MAQETTPATRTMSDAEWQHNERLWRAAGADEIAMFALAVGCPRHGNAAMDFDPDASEPFCMACDHEQTVARRVAAESEPAAEFAAFLAGEPSERISALIFAAYKRGSDDALMGRPALDLADAGSAALMAALGLTGPTTAANEPLRVALCDEYLAGHDDASAALR